MNYKKDWIKKKEQNTSEEWDSLHSLICIIRVSEKGQGMETLFLNALKFLNLMKTTNPQIQEA